MQTRIIRGHGVSDRDRLGMPFNVVITETAARRLFPNEDPIGKRMKRGPVDSPAPWMTMLPMIITTIATIMRQAMPVRD